MNRDKFRTRSKSQRRKMTLSSEKNLDETTLIKMLDERAQPNKTILITKEQLKALKNYKKLYLNLQKNYEKEKKTWITERNDMKLAKNALQQENQELKTHLKDIDSKVSLLQSSTPDSSTEQQNNLAKIKESLYNLENLIAYRSEESAKLLLKLHQLLAKHAKVLLEQPIISCSKPILTEGIRKISQTITALETLIVSQKDSIPSMETQEESSSEAYKKALEKMKVQTLQLREKLKELENGEGLKKVIEDQDIKIQLLSKEKSRLNSCISQLRDSLKEQNDTINHLKSLISTPKPGTNQYTTPSREYATYKNYLEHDENDIHQEIANLDSEIQLLQNSLKQALITN